VDGVDSNENKLFRIFILHDGISTEKSQIFGLQKKQCALPAAKRVGFLRDKKRFCKRFLSLKRPVKKFK
jgi:hypothetical protein